MAVSESERQSILAGDKTGTFALLPDEPFKAQKFISSAILSGTPSEIAWREYVRLTHGLRTGARLRKHLGALGSVFAETVAKIAEGHSKTLREVRDPERYPLALSVFGESVNIAAITTYVRMIDLLDVGEDRTPFALWSFVAPADPISILEWRKHRALSPVAVKQGSALREVLITGHTDDSAVFASLHDLRAWIDEQFAGSIAQLRTISGQYDIDLDSRIIWNIEAIGFKPLSVRFELDRREVLGLLSSELYKDDSHAFVRELLQNSVDAIDMREALLAKHGLTFKGEIHISLTPNASGLRIEWRDNGFGMDEDVIVSFLARPGQCWYRSREASDVAQIDAISRFGIGVLSFFAVSDSLTIETQRDPQIGVSRPGLIVEIPSRDSHFRISVASNMQVGTMVRMEIPPRLCSVISIESVCETLGRIARYVRHRIVVEYNGVLLGAPFLPGTRNTSDAAPSSEDLGLEVVAMQGDSATKLEDLCTTITFDIEEPSGEYYVHYSAVVPNRPAEVTNNIDTSVWSLGEKRIDLDNILVNSEEALFVKGIRTGRVAVRNRRTESGFYTARYTLWIRPRFFLNVRRPSHIEFNLDRSSARLKSDDWIDAAWREIASKLQTTVFGWPISSNGDLALLLGSCAIFGAVPDCGLDALVETNQCPLPVLRAHTGPIWVTLREFAHGNEFVEAPFELAYANKDSIEIGSSSGLEGWEGDDVLVPIEGFSSYRFPWLPSVVAFGFRALTHSNWHPVAIHLVRAPESEPVPLVCRVWRRLTGLSLSGTRDQEEPTATDGKDAIGKVLKNLYKEAPEVLQFPPSMEQYAAFGSRYWNINHPKVILAIKTLTKLMDYWRLHRISSDSQHIVSHLASNTFYGYVVPARYSDVDLALEVPNRLMDVAKKEGIGIAEHLVPADFVPGTIGEYRNPYHYDLRKWKNPGTRLGQRLD